MDNRPIGVFDSGVGGITVLHKLEEALKSEKYIYFGDTKNLPYGEKSPKELIEITREIFDWFKRQNVKAVVMACNTTSAVAYDALKDFYDYEIYPLIQTSVSQMKFNDKVGVFSTRATANSGKYKSEIIKVSPKTNVYETGCPGWVEIVEGQAYQEPQSIDLMNQRLNELRSLGVIDVILGCTHYPYLESQLKELAPEMNFIDPSKYFVKYLAQNIEQNNLKTPSSDFYVSSNPRAFFESSKLFYKLNELPNEISFPSLLL